MELNSAVQFESKDFLISSNLSYLMELKSTDSKQLSQQTGIAASTINGIKRGLANPTLSTLTALAHYFGITISDLTEKNLRSTSSRRNTVHDIPLFNQNELCQHLTHQNKSNRSITTELDTTSAEGLFAVKINNNALYPLFEKGTIFILKEKVSVNDGDIVLVKFKTTSICFRRVFIEPHRYYFKALAEDVESKIDCSENFDILGVVIKAIQSFQ